MTNLPWHDGVRTQILSVIQQRQLTHAWIVCGTKGTGRESFSFDLSQYLLCEQPLETSACGHCQSCHWFVAETHPDCLVIKPEAEGKAIKVDQIRDLIEKLSLTAHGRHGRRVVIISPAEAMNHQAANSLLKSLEEPPENTYFFLITSELSALPATIRSRCQLLNMPGPNAQQACEWLEQASGSATENSIALEMADNAPLTALMLLNSGAIPIYQQLFAEFLQPDSQQHGASYLAEQWLKQEQYMPINWMLRWLSVLIKLKQSNGSVVMPFFQKKGLETLIHGLTLEQLFRFYDDVLEVSRQWSAPLNRRLQLESLFTKWLRLFQ